MSSMYKRTQKEIVARKLFVVGSMSIIIFIVFQKQVYRLLYSWAEGSNIKILFEYNEILMDFFAVTFVVLLAIPLWYVVERRTGIKPKRKK
jgi:hypothetical protein